MRNLTAILAAVLAIAIVGPRTAPEAAAAQSPRHGSNAVGASLLTAQNGIPEGAETISAARRHLPQTSLACSNSLHRDALSQHLVGSSAGCGHVSDFATDAFVAFLATPVPRFGNPARKI